MPSQIFSLLRGAPSLRLLAALGLGLLLGLAAILLAFQQPRFGLHYEVRDGAVFASGPPVEKALNVPSARVLAIRSQSGENVRLSEHSLIEEPNFLPDFPSIRAFIAEQDRIHGLLDDAPSVVLADGKGQHVVKLVPASRTPPFAFWYQLFVGLSIYAVAVWIWVVAPGKRANLLFALSGFGMLLAAGTAGIYSTREIALAGLTFRWLGIGNEIGASLFGIAMSHLFLIYPVRLVSDRVAAGLWVFFGLWTVAGAARLVPSPAWGNNGTMFAEMVLIAIAIAIQFFATRGDPVGRSALRWFGIGTIFGAGGFIMTAVVPLLFNSPALVDQGTAFGFFLIIVVGLAIGLRRDRLFAVDSLSYSILFYSGFGILVFAIDLGLLFLLGSQRIAGLATGAAVLPILYSPVRDRVIAWIGGAQRADIIQSLEDLTTMNFLPPGIDRTQQWKLCLDDAFQPLAIEEASHDEPVRIVDDGMAMVIPSVAGAPPLRLKLAGRGRRLFRQHEQDLAERMVTLAARADTERLAYERGIEAERARVARDLHDDLAARLMDGLAHDQVESLRETIRQSLVEVRSIVNGSRGVPMLLAEAIADARSEAVERLEVAGIALDWIPGLLPGRLNPAQVRALQSALRETMTNIIRHSQATQASVDMVVENDLMVIQITDNGRPGEVVPGNGLRNLAARLRSVGGSAVFMSNMTGFCVTLSMPIEEAK